MGELRADESFEREDSLEREDSPETEEPLHRSLWRSHSALAEACLNSRFVRGIGAGTLDPAVFKKYVAQDAFFLRAFFAAYALAAARTAERIEVARRLHVLMQGVLDELELHASYAGKLGIDLDDVIPNDAARGYTDFLARTAWSADAGVIVAAMAPCMRLYAWLGQELLRGRQLSPGHQLASDQQLSPGHRQSGGRLPEGGAVDGGTENGCANAGLHEATNPYQEWIDTYASPGFEELAATLEALLDDLVPLGPVGSPPMADEAYGEAMRHELAFFRAFDE